MVGCVTLAMRLTLRSPGLSSRIFSVPTSPVSPGGLPVQTSWVGGPWPHNGRAVGQVSTTDNQMACFMWMVSPLAKCCGAPWPVRSVMRKDAHEFLLIHVKDVEVIKGTWGIFALIRAQVGA